MFVSPTIGLPFKFHWLPLASEEVNNKSSPWQNVFVGLEEVINGVVWEAV